MAETVKILSHGKKVLLPDLNAGCSLAESCPRKDFADFKKKYPEHTVISYINTTTDIKALTDIICTSSNALEIVKSLPKDEKIIFTPDKNLGNYVKNIAGKDMIIWNGSCHVNTEFSFEKILGIKKKYHTAKIIAHPECEKDVLIIANHIGSTSSLLEFTKKDDANEYIVATESGILHQMKKKSPHKTFKPAPTKDFNCDRNDCNFIKLNTMGKLYNCLKYELPEITIKEKIRKKAEIPIERMLKISEKSGI